MSNINLSEKSPVVGISQLSLEEVECVAGGPGPVGIVLGAGAIGGAVGGGTVLLSEMTDGRPGVNWGNVVIGTAAGVGAGISTSLGWGAAIVGGIAFGGLAERTIKVNISIGDIHHN